MRTRGVPASTLGRLEADLDLARIARHRAAR
jgi:hypothetical protein